MVRVFACGLCLCSVRGRNVALMLLIAACEQVAAIGHCDIIVIIMALRVACSVKRGIARVANRSGRQAFRGIKVVRGIALEILVGELAARTAETVQDRCIHLKIREFALFRRL